MLYFFSASGIRRIKMLRSEKRYLTPAVSQGGGVRNKKRAFSEYPVFALILLFANPMCKGVGVVFKTQIEKIYFWYFEVL